MPAVIPEPLRVFIPSAQSHSPPCPVAAGINTSQIFRLCVNKHFLTASKEPGEYNIALQAAVEEPETSKYLKFHEFFLEEADALPIGVNDLRISVKSGCVKLMWTAPEAYNTGKKLEFITKIEIYRNN